MPAFKYEIGDEVYYAKRVEVRTATIKSIRIDEHGTSYGILVDGEEVVPLESEIHRNTNDIVAAIKGVVEKLPRKTER